MKAAMGAASQIHSLEIKKFSNDRLIDWRLRLHQAMHAATLVQRIETSPAIAGETSV
jgi:hypothetical protein